MCVCVLKVGWPGRAGDGAQMRILASPKGICGTKRREREREFVRACVHALPQYEPQLCDLLTLSKTLTVRKDDQLKEKTHNDPQLFSENNAACNHTRAKCARVICTVCVCGHQSEAL